MHLQPKGIFTDQLIKADSLSGLVNGSYRCIEDALSNIQDGEVLLSRWLFRFSAGAIAHMLWDETSPWVASTETIDDLM